jgi:diaminopimelate epimerase
MALPASAARTYNPPMEIPFIKMHGAGNDFVVLDGRAQSLGLTPERIRLLADRRLGIGCDQLISLEPASQGADVFMRIHNPEGSEAGACGNATRCVASLIGLEQGLGAVTIRTISGDLPASLLADGRVTVDLGPPRLGWTEVPLAVSLDTLHLPLAEGSVADPAACSMGNPHATFFVPTLDGLDIAGLGARFETDALFPDRANIGFAEIIAADRIRLRLWERGAGLTLACGSGACAALVNAVRRGLATRRATLLLDGGTLTIEWREADGHVLMTGPAETSFSGIIDLDARRPAIGLAA